MKQASWWSTSIAALGSSIAVSATLLYYVQAHRSGVPGGYFALCLGALGVGVLAGATGYFAAPTARRAAPTAVAVAVGVSLATSGVLVATLIRAFGS